jgi:hypothetical protein
VDVSPEPSEPSPPDQQAKVAEPVAPEPRQGLLGAAWIRVALIVFVVAAARVLLDAGRGAAAATAAGARRKVSSGAGRAVGAPGGTGRETAGFRRWRHRTAGTSTSAAGKISASLGAVRGALGAVRGALGAVRFARSAGPGARGVVLDASSVAPGTSGSRCAWTTGRIVHPTIGASVTDRDAGRGAGTVRGRSRHQELRSEGGPAAGGKRAGGGDVLGAGRRVP